MQDKVSLVIAGRKLEGFKSYEVEADLYQAADRFTLELANPWTGIRAGMRCEVYVNDQLELTGIIDATRKAYGKRGSSLSVEGRDLMGLLVDSCAEQFVAVQGKKLKDLAELLLKSVPYISRKKVSYQENVAGRLKGKKKTVDSPLTAFQDTPQKLSHIEPGMTVFEVLSVYAASRGLLFFSLPDGTFVFGRPKVKGEPPFTLTCRRDGRGNNIESAEEVDDISRRYSRITVLSQVQGQEEHGQDAGLVNVKATVEDKSFPFYKPFVTKLNSDSQSPKLHGRMLMEKQRHDGFALSYTVTGHSQGGANWRINELVQVEDELLERSGVYLIYSRLFRRSKEEGSTTTLRLGPPGLVAAV